MKKEKSVKLTDVLAELQALAQCAEDRLDNEISGAYCSDLLSDVMANAGAGNLWITLQTHPNIVAVASLAGLSGVIISRGLTPDPETLAKAAENNIPVLTSPLPSFVIAGKLYRLLGLE